VKLDKTYRKVPNFVVLRLLANDAGDLSLPQVQQSLYYAASTDRQNLEAALGRQLLSLSSDMTRNSSSVQLVILCRAADGLAEVLGSLGYEET